MKFYTINESYMEYLRKDTPSVPFSDYGERYKPFVGILFQNDECCFLAPISSYKEHYASIHSESLVKIHDSFGQIVSVLNLSRMFPVPPGELIEVKYKEIDLYCHFNNQKKREQYIRFLNIQLKDLHQKNVPELAEKVYQERSLNRHSSLGINCLDFKRLECRCTEWILKHEYEIEASIHYSGHQFQIETENGSLSCDYLDPKEIVTSLNEQLLFDSYPRRRNFL